MYSATVQHIQRVKAEQWYISLPIAMARLLHFKGGEVVEWEIKSTDTLNVRRTHSTSKAGTRSAGRGNLRRTGFPSTVQHAQREKSEQWYVNFPTALARALQFKKGETIEWTTTSNSALLQVQRTRH